MSKLPSLNRALLQGGFTLPKNIAVGPLVKRPEKVLQFGEGNFLRAFVDWLIDEANERTDFNGSVVVAQPIAQGMAAKLNEQDGLYTLIARGKEGGKVVDSRRLITSISRALNPYEDWAELVKFVTGPDIRIVVSNTTEAGIAYAPEPHTPGKVQTTFPAKVANLLYERFQAVNGDAARGLIFIPCELIERNGAKLREYVLKYAADWNLGADFTAWVEKANVFFSTLVDRIVPGYPRAEAETLVNEFGYQDNLIDTGEIFHLWVLEGPAQYADEFPLAKAGLNVIWTADQTPYRTRKVRILNGAHTSSVLIAFLGGLDTVGELMDDPLFGRFIRRAVFDEIAPALPMEEAGKKAYAEAVMERFQNPFIRHELLSISLNSVSKWKVRVLPSLLDSLKNTGKLPAVLAFSLAALVSFYKGEPAPQGGLQGKRNGVAYPIRDDASVMEFFKNAWTKFGSEPALLAKEVLAQTAFWGQDLNTLPGFTDAVANGLRAIQTQGARAAVEALLA
jgi:tagaturonate reductase